MKVKPLFTEIGIKNMALIRQIRVKWISNRGWKDATGHGAVAAQAGPG
jgi:hypothetical protein